VEHVSLFAAREKELIHNFGDFADEHDQTALYKRSELVERTSLGDKSMWPVGVVMGVSFTIPLLVLVIMAFSCMLALQSEFKFDAELNAQKKLK
jgi:hypothetical protein